MATKKRPTRFRQGRRQGKVDSKKVFQGAAKAGLKDKDRFTKFSADDIKALNEMKEGSRKGFITDDKGNKIQTEKFTKESAKQYWEDVRKADKAASKAEALRKFPYDADELKSMSKADRAAAEASQKRISEPKASSSGKPEGRTASSTQKVRSGVTVNEPKPQGYKVDKDGNKIKEPKAITETTRRAAKNKALANSAKGKTQTPTAEAARRSAKPEGKKLPVSKKGFAAGKELNAEGKAMYDKFIKEGIKPKSALNKALFRQEKGAKVAAKAAGPVATAAKSAASKVKKQGPVKAPSTIGSMGTSRPEGLTPKVQKEIRAKYKAASGNKVLLTKGLMGQPKQTPIKVTSKVVSSKPNVPGKELAVRPKPGAVVAKAASSSAKKKFTAKGAALGAAKFAGKAVTGKVGMAVTAASLLGGPLIKQLTKDKNRITSADVMKGREQAAIKANSPQSTVKSRSNQPRITGQGKFIGKGNVPTINSGGSTSTYKVNAGDTLSGIAKKSGVTLSELMAANKKIKDPRKIYRNTPVNIPSKGKVPTGGYAGPVPYRPKKK